MKKLNFFKVLCVDLIETLESAVYSVMSTLQPLDMKLLRVS